MMQRQEDIQDLLNFVRGYRKKMDLKLKRWMKETNHPTPEIEELEKLISDYKACEHRLENQMKETKERYN